MIIKEDEKKNSASIFIQISKTFWNSDSVLRKVYKGIPNQSLFEEREKIIIEIQKTLIVGKE